MYDKLFTMHRYRSRTLLLTIVGLAFVFAMPAGAGEAEETVSLRWALGALDTEGGKPSAIQRDTQLESGSRLKFLVEPLSTGSVYLIMLDSADDIQVLYRRDVAPSVDAEPAYIPPGSHWFEIDNEPGMETFFLLASAKPLTDLDTLLDTLDGMAEGAEGRKDVGRKIVQEIRAQNKAHRNFARPVEKPVMIGGQTRGEQDAKAAIDSLAVDVSAERFYGKTITIDH